MLRDVLERSFVLVTADWPAGDVRKLVRRLQSSHLIVSRISADGAEAHYLLRRDKALAILASKDDKESVHAAFGLDQREPTPVFDAYDDELSALDLDQAVVLEEGRVIGFVDSEVYDEFVGATRSFLKAPTRSEAVQPAQRTLVTDFPSQVVVGQTASLVVFLSADSSDRGLPVAVPAGTEVDVVVVARRRFEVVGAREGAITVTDSDEALPLAFKLKATDEGLGAVLICVFAGGRSLGGVTIESRVVASADAAAEGPPSKREKPLPPSVGEAAPDLTLIITEHTAGRSLSFTLRTRDPEASPRMRQAFGPVPLRTEPLDYFRDFFARIERLPTDTPAERRAAEQALGARGALLFDELVPPDLRTLLWTQRRRIRTVQVQSQEPWIPWELCRLHGWDDGRIQGGEFFAEAFAITRWLPDLADKLALPLRRIALVVPKTSGLAHAASEEEYMRSLGDGGRVVECVPATRDDVLVALKDKDYDGWHFICHGSAGGPNPDHAELELDDGVIRPAQLAGEVQNLGLRQPLVFLNACQSGRSAVSLTDIGGWAARFLRAAVDEEHPTHGAAAFIGTYWKIDDGAALEFAKAFYTALLRDRRPVGDAVMQARSAIRPLGPLDWLAHTVFAHPLAKAG
jgi:CHAT domain-containing protein